MSKRNAALEAILGAAAPEGDERSQMEKAVGPTGEGSAGSVVALRPAKPRKTVTKVMLYLPAKVARKFKEIAFTEECKANDIYLDALDLYLAKYGYGGVKAVSER